MRGIAAECEVVVPLAVRLQRLAVRLDITAHRYPDEAGEYARLAAQVRRLIAEEQRAAPRHAPAPPEPPPHRMPAGRFGLFITQHPQTARTAPEAHNGFSES